MKAKRRQELKTNDLAQAIEDLGNFFKDWGVYVVGGACIIVIAVVISAYMRNARAAAMEQAYADLRAASNMFTAAGERKSDEEVRENLDRMAELAAVSRNESFRLDALMRRGTLAVGLAEAGDKGIDGDFLSDAKSAYQEVIDTYAHSTLRYGRALYGMFQIEADQFAIDQDPAHRDRAVGYLEMLRDDARFNGTPLQTVAVDMLNDIDSVFGAVTFAKRPTPSPVPGPVPGAALTTSPPPGFADLLEAAAPEAASSDEPGEVPATEESPPDGDSVASPPKPDAAKPADQEAAPDGSDATEPEASDDAAP